MIWTPEHDEHLYGMLAEGWTYKEIGLALGVSKSAVSGRIGRMRHAGRIRLMRREKRQAARRESKIHNAVCVAPYAPDCSVPDFANNEAHVAACLRLGGFPVLRLRAA